MEKKNSDYDGGEVRGGIEARGLKKTFGDNVVLDDFNLTVERGSLLSLLGPNGAGKTTTIRILTTLIRPDAGTAFIDGLSVTEEPARVREKIGLTGQYAAVDEYLTGFENLVMMGRLYHLAKPKAISRAKELLAEFDLEKFANKAVKTYSGGMRRKLDLAASLTASPPVLFLDEPTTGLDPRSRLAMWEIIQKLVEGDTTILLTTQQLEEADTLADRVAVLDGGRIIAEGTADELKSRVGNDRLEMVFKDGQAFIKAREALSGRSTREDEKRRTISLSVDDGIVSVRNILDKVDASGAEVETFSLRKPTLDDVFLKLTGHTAQDEKTQ